LFDADPDPEADTDPTFHPDADPDPDPSFQIKAKTLEKKLKYAHIPYTLACHLQIDQDAVPVYHFDADPDSDFYLMRMRIHNTVHTDQWETSQWA
jgi:hypothetical protein